MKNALKDLDTDLEYRAQVRDTQQELAARQEVMRPGDPYKDINLLPIDTIAMQSSEQNQILMKLHDVELLAERVHMAGHSSDAERAYSRILIIYRSLGSSVATSLCQLLIKVADFFQNGEEPLQAEKHLLEVLRHPNSPSFLEEDVKQRLYKSYPRSSEDLSRHFQNKEGANNNIAVNFATPFPVSHRIIRNELAHSASSEILNQKVRDITGSFPLHCAITSQMQAAVLTLLKHADETMLEERDVYGRSPLFLCALYRNEDAGKVILVHVKQYPAGIQERIFDHRDCLGQTILAVAVQTHCSLDFLTMLIKSGVKVDPEELMENTFTPLQAAASIGREDVVHLLLQYHADPSRTYFDEATRTAAQLAQEAGHFDIAALLGFSILT